MLPSPSKLPEIINKVSLYTSARIVPLPPEIVEGMVFVPERFALKMLLASAVLVALLAHRRGMWWYEYWHTTFFHLNQ